jgi:iron complex outermembrane recepter protein
MRAKNLLQFSILASCTLLAAISQAEDKNSDSKTESKPLKDIFELPEITVSAAPLSPSLSEYGSAISVIDEKELKKRSTTTLGETISLEPGVSSSFFGQGASRPVIRGQSGDRVRILNNGVGTQDVSNFSEDHVVVADPLQSNTIEILRGSETLLYGSSAIGGIVNVLGNSAPDQRVGKGFAFSSLGQLGNSADNEKTLSARLSGDIGKFTYSASAFSRETDDYEIPGMAESQALIDQEAAGGEEHEEEDTGGKVNNTATDTNGATVGSSYFWKKGFVGLSVSGFQSDYGIPGNAHENEDDQEHEEGEAHEETQGVPHEEEAEEAGITIAAEQIRADITGRVDTPIAGLKAIKFRTGISDYEHDELEGSEVGTTFSREATESRIEFLHDPIGNFEGLAGLQMIYDDTDVAGDEAFLPNTTTVSPAAFAFEKLGLTDRLSWQFGGRIESVNYNPDGNSSSLSFLPFSLSTGPVFDLVGDNYLTLGTTLSYSERAPAPIELYADGVHAARQIFEQGDSTLDKERSVGLDVSLRKNEGIVTGAVSTFAQNFSNYINLTGNSETEDNTPVFAYEETKAIFYGAEYENTLHVDRLLDLGNHNLALDLQFDYLRSRETSSSENIPRTPPLRTIARANYGWGELLNTMVEGVFANDQNKVAQDELATDGYSLLNAEVAVSPEIAGSRDTSFFVNGRNLTDEEARVHSSFLKDLAPLRGRSLLFGIRMNL